MKFLSSLFLVLLSTLCSSQTDITPAVTAALSKGNAMALATHMMPQIELTLNGQDNNLSKAEAQKALAGFFKEHVVATFAIKHQGTSKLDDQYRIGDLATSKGNFRVTFFMKKTSAVMQIRQLKIETDAE